MPEIQTNLERVRERIARAAERAGRSHDDVLLVGVSKTVDVHRIREAVAAGLGALGENRVQEARGKIAEIGRPVALQAGRCQDGLLTKTRLGRRDAPRWMLHIERQHSTGACHGVHPVALS